MPSSLNPDIICFSHLRWDLVYQRPHHLLSRFAVDSRVFYIEEPRFEDITCPRYAMTVRGNRLWTVTPLLPLGYEHDPRGAGILRSLLDEFLAHMCIERFVAWYYTPMALEFSVHLDPILTIYDCMDELSRFAHAPKPLVEREAQLLQRSDLVFTGGQSLYEEKRQLHPDVHLFPSAVDAQHFRVPSEGVMQPRDQADIPGPRLGFYGVIDERMDVRLVREVAEARPEWHLVMVGPVVKIDLLTLPQRPNIHYLGAKKYEQLPSYLAGWDIAIMPFALNEATRFISPTKTLEYLAGRKPVISTGVRDVVEPYGRMGMVSIAAGADQFIACAERILAAPAKSSPISDTMVDALSWERTWHQMSALIVEQLTRTVAVAT